MAIIPSISNTVPQVVHTVCSFLIRTGWTSRSIKSTGGRVWSIILLEGFSIFTSWWGLDQGMWRGNTQMSLGGQQRCPIGLWGCINVGGGIPVSLTLFFLFFYVNRSQWIDYVNVMDVVQNYSSAGIPLEVSPLFECNIFF